MSYYILNINRNGKSEVDDWISKKNIAPIFYGNSTLDNIRKNSEHKLHVQAYLDARLFVDTFSSSINENDIIFSIGDQYVYFYKQGGELVEFENDGNNLVKGFKISLIEKFKISECPLVLVTIKSNRYISSGTFRKIEGEKYYGNINAIDYLLQKRQIEVNSFDKYLQCLSSLEFETLIAKYLEEFGFFVPAYKGGYVKNYDLFCRNISQETISIHNKNVSPNTSISIQVKLKINENVIREYLDLYFCIWSDIKNKNIINWTKLHQSIESMPETKKWLKQTLFWVNLIEINTAPKDI